MANITGAMYNDAKKNIRDLRVKINVLNFNMQTVDEITGVVLDGSINVDATADIRRTCSLSLVVKDSTLELQPGGRIWVDKYFQVLIDYLNKGDWINMGIYLVDAPSWSYDPGNSTLSLQGLDLMSKLTGQRNGYLEGIPTIIPQDSSIRDSMISTLVDLGGFNNYVIEDNPQPVPYEIKIDQGGTVYDILSELRDITPNYEIFFDVDGVFHYQQIPSGQNEASYIQEDMWKQIVLSESTSVDFGEVKNVVEVYGMSHDPSHYGEATVDGNTYNVTMAGVDSLTKGLIYGFKAPSIVENPMLKINSLPAYPLVNEDGTTAVIPQANKFYVVQYKGEENFLFLGYQQPYAIAKDENPDSPFYINTIGEIRQVFYGDEYENIWSNDLAQQRANYELWLHTRLNDSISLSVVPLYWLDVNILVDYTRVNTTETNQYIIKSIDTSLSPDGSQTINMVRYYPLYPDI
nr:MAG TPA: protein of unknown function DUF5048 [Caudoviricetes sp.]